MSETYHWLSYTTGELQGNLIDVFKSIIEGIRYYKFLNWNWRYSRKGF